MSSDQGARIRRVQDLEPSREVMSTMSTAAREGGHISTAHVSTGAKQVSHVSKLLAMESSRKVMSVE
jgi:hypothetical protein